MTHQQIVVLVVRRRHRLVGGGMGLFWGLRLRLRRPARKAGCRRQIFQQATACRYPVAPYRSASSNIYIPNRQGVKPPPRTMGNGCEVYAGRGCVRRLRQQAGGLGREIYRTEATGGLLWEVLRQSHATVVR